MRDPGGFLHEPANRAGRHKKPAWTKIRANTDECYAEARRLLRENRDKLDAIVTALLAHESLDEPEIYAAAGIPPRPALAPQPAPIPA